MAHQTLQGPGPVPRRRKVGAARAELIPFRAGCWVLAVASTTWLLAASLVPVRGQDSAPPRGPVPPGTNLGFQQPGGQPAQPGAVPGIPSVPKTAGPAAPADATLPQPRRADIFSGHPRLEALPASVPAPLGTTPAFTKEVKEKFGKYVENFIDPENNLDLILGRPRLMNLKESPFRIQIADEYYMTYNLITARELSLQGIHVGSTVMNLWFGDPAEPAKQTILSYLVHVLPDPEAKERLERAYKALEDEVNKAFPDAYVCLFLVGDKLVVSGEAKDAHEATKILQIIRAQAPAGSPTASIPVGQVNLNLNATELGPDGLPRQALENFLLSGESNIVNLLRIPGEQQVMLKVTVAEISRSAARSIGLNFSITNHSGIQVFAQNTGSLASTGGTFSTGTSLANAGTGTGGGINLPAMLDNGRVSLLIEALRNISLARSLAEPNLVTLNGQPATFLAGGEFPVPIVTGATATGLQGVSFVPFGVQLQFTPFITDKDRIRLSLNATVSVRDVALGSNFGGGAGGQQGGGFVPGLNTRTVTTTVEMREGQTLAIGGLLQTNLGGQTSRVPGIGDLPIIGHIGRVDETSASESELVLLVTPQLVHPMEPKDVPPLPGSDYFEPGDLEFYLYGRLESRRSYDYRSTVMSTPGRMAAYRHCELLYFVGPHGHSDAKP